MGKLHTAACMVTQVCFSAWLTDGRYFVVSGTQGVHCSVAGISCSIKRIQCLVFFFPFVSTAYRNNNKQI